MALLKLGGEICLKVFFKKKIIKEKNMAYKISIFS